MIPNVSVKKTTIGGTPALQSVQGILAIIAAASTGTSLPPTMLTNPGMCASTFGNGMLPECAAYTMSVAGLPVVGQACVPTTTGSYGTITSHITGACVVTAGSTHPYLHYNVQVTVTAGGTVGVAGIFYTYSLDGGITVVGPIALGTATTLTIPNSGVSFSLTTATLLTGDNWSVYTERPELNNSDVTAQLAVLGNTKLPWEGVLIDAAYATDTLSIVDNWLAERETNGQFNFALLNTRYLLEPTPTAEAPSVYAAAMATLTGSDASNRVCVGADGGHMTSVLTGLTTKFPTSLALGAMAMSVTPNIGTDPAYVGLGPVPGFEISQDGNPNDWDEFLYQSLDSLRLTTLRSFASGGPVGTFITNANVLIPTGSNIVWLQLLRVMNRACSIAWQILTGQLSAGVQTQFNKTTNAVNIKETSAQTIEGLVNGPLTSALSGQCTGVQFALNRDDDLSVPNSPVNGTVSIAPLVYLKNIVVQTALVKTITTKGS